MRVFSFSELSTADLVVDALYEGGEAGHVGDDPLARLLPVGNRGGFRYKGSPPTPQLVALVSTGREPAWPDELDPYTGVFTYFGDNRRPGHQLHDTQRRGNAILADSYARTHSHREARAGGPVFLVFERTGVRRHVVFRGLAVPGAASLSADEDLVAVWRTIDGERFQNYRSRFTVLDVPVVTRMWVNDLLAGEPLSNAAPSPWRRWVETRAYAALVAPRVGQIRSKVQQLPGSPAERERLKVIYERCRPDPVSFERVAGNCGA